MIQAVYSKAKPKILKGEIDLTSDSIKLALLTGNYLPVVGNEFWSAISVNEIISSGSYVPGGASLADKAVAEDTTNEESIFDAGNVRWTSLTATFRYAVLYKDTGDPAASPLIAYFDYETDQVLVGQPYQITWNLGGIIRLL
jgi:hypothetical protein